MSIRIKNNIYWVGKIDWELRKFHGDEYSTHRGSSYNSYLVKEDKVALIDTVWKPFAKEFVENLANVIDLNKIDYIIANHAESDHSGALPELMRIIPLVSVAGILEEIKGLKFKNKKAAAFGCYGWSGESIKIISESLNSAGFEITDEGIKVLWNPDDESTTKCTEYGKKFVANISD